MIMLYLVPNCGFFEIFLRVEELVSQKSNDKHLQICFTTKKNGQTLTFQVLHNFIYSLGTSFMDSFLGRFSWNYVLLHLNVSTNIRAFPFRCYTCFSSPHRFDLALKSA